MKIGIIGLGKMGEAIVEGLRKSARSKEFELRGTVQSEVSASDAAQRLRLAVTTDNAELAQKSKVLILCVKPHHAERVLEPLSKILREDQLLISICASITTGQISQWSGGKPAIIRAMPNTPCLIGQGMTVFSPAAGLGSEQLKIAEDIFGTLGQTAVVEEDLMDGVTGLSGCGPAYVYLMIEALSEAGVKVGLPRKVSTLLAAQTLAGAAKMVLLRGEHPAALKDEVTTPAGCTIDGLMALEEGKLRVTLVKAVLAAAKRSRSLRTPKGFG